MEFKENPASTITVPKKLCVGFFLECDGISLLQYTESMYSQIHHKRRKENYEEVETRKKLALYENIKFYDYIP